MKNIFKKNTRNQYIYQSHLLPLFYNYKIVLYIISKIIQVIEKI